MSFIPRLQKLVPKEAVVKKVATASLANGSTAKVELYKNLAEEVSEIYGLAINAPVNANTNLLRKLEARVIVDGTTLSTLLFDGQMSPYGRENSVMKPIQLGEPYLWTYQRGRLPTLLEGTTIKVAPSQRVEVEIKAKEAFSAGEDTEVIAFVARAKDADALNFALRGASSVSLATTLPDGTIINAGTVTLSRDNWDELQGGTNQNKIKVDPFVVYSENKNATTTNENYKLNKDNVPDASQKLFFDNDDKSSVYIIERLGVVTHSNLKKTKIIVEGKGVDYEYVTRPYPEFNALPTWKDDMSYNLAVKDGVRMLPNIMPPFVVSDGRQSGVAILDNGTSIPANGVRVHAVGKVISGL